jgi:hypothetical protein
MRFVGHALDDFALAEERLPRWLPPLAVGSCFTLFAFWSWGKWTDPQIDFGNELYTAWQIGEGRPLYADMAYRNGPFSHYLNALWFLLFGASVRTLVLCNLAILVAITAMLMRILRLSCGRIAAAVCACFFLAVFAFSQYGLIANFNYVTPYQHAQTHGILLGFSMILAIVEAERRGSALWSALAGACLGLLFLGKVEIFVPAAATALAGAWVLARGEGVSSRDALHRILAMSAGAVLPVLLCFALLWSAMPANLAWLGVRGNWAYLGDALLSDRFYVAGAGMEDIVGNGLRALAAFLGIALVALAVATADRFLPVLRRAQWSAAAGVVCFLLLWRVEEWIPWKPASRGLPFSTFALLAMLWLPALRRHLPERLRERWLPVALWSLYGLGLLGKMLLNARFGHYGFVLAMPATLLIVATLVEVIPAHLRERHGGGQLAFALSLAVLAAAAVFFWGATDRIYARKNFALGRGPDVIVVEDPKFMSRGLVMARTMEELEKQMGDGDTLLVLPEGMSLNFWLRRVNPTPYHLFLPTELAAFGGDERMLDDIRKAPPDFIVLAHRGHLEFGTGPFGVDPRNGRRLMEWVRQDYDVVMRVGAPPFKSPHFGTLILQRKDRKALQDADS